MKSNELLIIYLLLLIISFICGVEWQSKKDCESRGGLYSLDYGQCLKPEHREVLK